MAIGAIAKFKLLGVTRRDSHVIEYSKESGVKRQFESSFSLPPPWPTLRTLKCMNCISESMDLELSLIFSSDQD